MNNMQDHVSHDSDFYAWTMKNAALLKNGNLNEIDAVNIAEELEDMGNSNKRALISHLKVLIVHLLKYKFQAERIGASWENTIEEQRLQIQSLLQESPSLKYRLDEKFDEAYKLAVLRAATEMGIKKAMLPATCPFLLEQCLNVDFFPK